MHYPLETKYPDDAQDKQLVDDEHVKHSEIIDEHISQLFYKFKKYVSVWHVKQVPVLLHVEQC